MLSGNFAEMTPLMDLLHAANLQHGTDGFTSPPKEGVLRIFVALTNPTNPRTWVLNASTLPLNHRSRSITIFVRAYHVIGKLEQKKKKTHTHTHTHKTDQWQ
jgi:hypothetical protein